MNDSNNRLSGRARLSDNLKIMGDKPSGPLDLPLFIFLIARLTESGEKETFVIFTPFGECALRQGRHHYHMFPLSKNTRSTSLPFLCRQTHVYPKSHKRTHATTICNLFVDVLVKWTNVITVYNYFFIFYFKFVNKKSVPRLCLTISRVYYIVLWWLPMITSQTALTSELTLDVIRVDTPPWPIIRFMCYKLKWYK